MPAKKKTKRTKHLKNPKKIESKRPLSAYPPDPCRG